MESLEFYDDNGNNDSGKWVGNYWGIHRYIFGSNNFIHVKLVERNFWLFI